MLKVAVLLCPPTVIIPLFSCNRAVDVPSTLLYHPVDSKIIIHVSHSRVNNGYLNSYSRSFYSFSSIILRFFVGFRTSKMLLSTLNNPLSPTLFAQSTTNRE